MRHGAVGVVALVVAAAVSGCSASATSAGTSAVAPAHPPAMTCPSVSPLPPQPINVRLRASWTLICEYGHGATAKHAVFRGDPLRGALLSVRPQRPTCDANFGHLAGVFRYDSTHLVNALTIKLYGCQGVVRPNRSQLQTWEFDQSGERLMYRLLHRVRSA